MTTYVEIAVNVPLVSGVFHYHLPPELEGRVEAGHLVVVPFGKQVAQGVMLRQVERPEVIETKAVLARVEPPAVLTPQQIELARWLSGACLAPLAACIALMLPPGLNQQSDVLYTAEPGWTNRGPALSDLAKRLLELLEKRGPLRGAQIDFAIPRVDWRPTARKLARSGALAGQPILNPARVQPKSVRTVQLACAPAAAEAALPRLARAGSAALARRQAVLRFLLREPGPIDVAWVYAESGGSLADLHALAELDLVLLGEGETWRDPLQNLEFQPAHPPDLTADQQRAWEPLRAALQRPGQVASFLLHGVTGSGKTEIYLRAVQEALAQGRQALVLVPEIALTPQTVRRFANRFPGQVGLLHSKLSLGERYDTWRRARSGALDVVVGPRSALFAPLERIGLIVVDECHDDSYYQSDTPPNYHAREAALAYARLAGAVCVLGSATPDVTTYYQAASGAARPQGLQLLELPARILAHQQAIQAQLARLGAAHGLPAPDAPPHPAGPQPSRAPHFQPAGGEAVQGDLPPVRVVDMRTELHAGNRSIFSRVLQTALQEVLARGEQAILFLNRRGSSTYVFCRDCGAALKCPRCHLPLTLHARQAEAPGAGLPAMDQAQAAGDLLCHHCSYRRQTPATCPACGSRQIRKYGAGTERVEAEIQSLFPGARTLRWDHETTRQKGAHELILSHFSSQRADILIGTQMLAKGLDLPLVTLVGAVLAEVGLNLPDYRAGERTFQVLTQVAGRAGRSPLGGQVILQSFEPDHYVIQAAARHDFAGFYRQELAFRRQLGYPPFTRLVRLELRHNDAAEAERQADEMGGQVRHWIAAGERTSTQISGPAPCFFSRVGGAYRWQIVLRGPDPVSLLAGRALGDWRVEVNPPSLL